MIITRAPNRVSLYGGGSDFVEHYRKHGGMVVGFAINKYSYITLRQQNSYLDYQSKIVYSKIEEVAKNSEIEHPIIKACLENFDISNIELHHIADLRGRSGLGSSSTFCVALCKALYAYQGKMVSSDEVAAKANYIERDYLKEAGGMQDAIWAAHGNFNKIDFMTDGTINVEPLPIKDLPVKFLLYYIGVQRDAEKITRSYQDRERCWTETYQIAKDGLKELQCGNARRIGKLLTETWECKKRLSKEVSNDKFDEVFLAAKRAGALGGKLLGAGGGGHLLIAVEPTETQTIRIALNGLTEIDYEIDREGAKVVYYDM